MRSGWGSRWSLLATDKWPRNELTGDIWDPANPPLPPPPPHIEIETLLDQRRLFKELSGVYAYLVQLCCCIEQSKV